MRDKIAAMLESIDATAFTPRIQRDEFYRVRGSELIDVFPDLAAVVRKINPENF